MKLDPEQLAAIQSRSDATYLGHPDVTDPLFDAVSDVRALLGHLRATGQL